MSKYGDYEKGVQAEDAAKVEWIANNTEETYENARQAEINSNALFDEFLEDPQG